MSPEVFWHFGIPKTGTSSFQRWLLDSNLDEERNFSITPRGLHEDGDRRFIENDFAEFEDITRAISSSKRPKFVISTEATTRYLFGAANLEKLLSTIARLNQSGHAVTLVGLLRRQDFLHGSLFGQLVRRRYVGTILDFKPNIDHYEMLSGLQAGLKAPNQLKVAVYVEGGDSLSQLRQLMGLQGGSESPSRENASASRHLQLLLASLRDERSKQLLFHEFQFSDTKVDYEPLMSPQERLALLRKYEQSNRMLGHWLTPAEIDYMADEALISSEWSIAEPISEFDLSRAAKLVRDSSSKA